MKNFYQLIVTAIFSTLSFGAFAQEMIIGPVNKVNSHMVTSHVNRVSHKATGATTYAFLDYTFSDSLAAAAKSETYNSSPLLGQYYIQDMNFHYTPADTGNPLTNQLLIRACSVSFDTLLDANTGIGYPISNSTVDSLFIPVGQQNISGKNDTLVISITSVGNYGIPAANLLWTTSIIQDTGLSGKGKSWFYGHTIVLAPHIAIPGSGKFAVTMQYYSENKRDSMGFLYGSPVYTCTTPAQVNPDTTFIGEDIPVTSPKHKLRANSYTYGYSWFTVGHKGASVVLPDVANGDFIGYPCTTPNNTSAGPFQDIAMFAKVSFTNTVTGLDGVSDNEFSVSQNYPNPFNKTTEIIYNVTKSSDVVFNVYDMTGRKLVDNTYSNVASGQHTISLTANQFTPGIYFYTFNVNGKSVTKKMVITE